MSAYRLTLVARRDVESLVRELARDDPRTAERAVDELFATFDWLAGTPEVGALRPDLAADAPAAGTAGTPDLRLWALRQWLLVYAAGPAGQAGPDEPGGMAGGGEPLTVLRVLQAGRPGWG